MFKFCFLSSYLVLLSFCQVQHALFRAGFIFFVCAILSDSSPFSEQPPLLPLPEKMAKIVKKIIFFMT